MKESTFIEIAKVIAKESKCVSLQVGAIIVKDSRIISMGYNGTISGSINCNECIDKEFTRDKHSEWSDSHEIHAEMNALMFAAKNGLSVNGCTLYCTHEPCDQCLKNIVQSGIERIVYLIPYKKERCKSKYRFDGSIKIEQFKQQTDMGKYFDIKELCKSDTATEKSIDNTPSSEAVERLNMLIDNVLDPLREWYGKPIYINSGYRCPELNKIVKGASNSFHLKGCACDIDMGDKNDNQPIFDYIKDNLPFTELGWEGNGRWVHVAYVKGREKEKEVFYA